MIDPDETVEEVHIATCLDRGRIALNQSGQHHCAMVLGKLQEEFDAAGEEFDIDPSKPLKIMNHLRVLSIIARCFMQIEKFNLNELLSAGHWEAQR